MKTLLKNNWKNILLIIGVVFIFMYFLHPKVEEVKVPVRVEVPVPVIEKDFDTVKKPKPKIIYKEGKTVTKIDSTYYKKYVSLRKDAVRLDSLFKETIKINKYKEVVEDDSLSITLNATVRGDLLKYQLGYKTKPRTIPLDTVLKIEIPTRAKVFGGFELTMPTTNTQVLGNEPVLSAKVYMKTKKDRLWSFGFNNQKQVTVGYAWKF